MIEAFLCLHFLDSSFLELNLDSGSKEWEWHLSPSADIETTHHDCRPILRNLLYT